MNLLFITISVIIIVIGVILWSRVYKNIKSIKSLKNELRITKGESDHWHRRYSKISQELTTSETVRREKERNIYELEDVLESINKKLTSAKKEHKAFVDKNDAMITDLKLKLNTKDVAIASYEEDKKACNKVIKGLKTTVTKLSKGLEESEQRHQHDIEKYTTIIEGFDKEIETLKKQLDSSISKPVKVRATTKRK